ncbi:proteasome assembly chaperone 4 [Amblyraja radiata]|uniref:proteasome assembly chaperone 4 n=1 Tax=Amblyraja radiata TaxID=386614 RepID=UPI0014041E8A|nr:proteasome assembly chaperone 4 [Amblyraja radiata]XP_032870616.1 proteasome assembly chaperone 4 [Amblyraja radiata]
MAAAAGGMLSVHGFSEQLCGVSVHFHLLTMSGSFLLWVGAAPTPSLSNLAVAMCTRLDPTPVSSLILGDASEITPTSIAQRLAKKTGKQVFVSYNLPSSNTSLSLEVENRIKQEMEKNPDKF